MRVAHLPLATFWPRLLRSVFGRTFHSALRSRCLVETFNSPENWCKATVIAFEDRLLHEMIVKNAKPTTRETQLPDQIDQHKNWTKQTKWLADTGGTRPLTVTYRTLTYYEN